MVDTTTNTNQILNPEIIAQKGEQIYREKFKDLLEKDHTGEFVAIDVEGEEYFLGKSADEVLNRAKAKFPSKIFHLIRIGFSGVYKVSWAGKGRNHGWIF